MSAEERHGPLRGITALMWGVVVCSAIFGVLASMHTTYRVSIKCRTLPLDDTELVRWYQIQDGVKNVVASRDGNAVDIEFSRRHGWFQMYSPPFDELGYKGLQTMESNIARPSLIGRVGNWIAAIPAMTWFGIAGLMLGFLVLNRLDTRSDGNSEVDLLRDG